MLKKLSYTEIVILKEANFFLPISRWETFEKAEAYYSKIDGDYVAFEEDISNLKSAYSTPVRVYMVRNYPLAFESF
jgi:hypothetical protein